MNIIPGDLREYFGEDEGFEAKRIMDVTETYLVHSCYRFLWKFAKTGLPMSRVRFFWDPESTKTIKPGVRHGLHVTDYILKEFTEVMGHGTAEDRQEKIPGIMRRSNDKKFRFYRDAYPGHTQPNDIPRNLLLPAVALLVLISLGEFNLSLLCVGVDWVEAS